MTEIQAKLIQAAKLLVEAAALGKANCEAYLDAHPENKSLSRRFDDVAHALQTNYTITIEGLIDMAARCNLPLLSDATDQARVDKDMNWIFRRNTDLLN